MTLKGENVPDPIINFGDVSFPDYVMNEITLVLSLIFKESQLAL